MFYHLIRYNTEDYDFKKAISDEFGVVDLDNLHSHLEKKYLVKDGVSGLSNDTHSRFHNMFYKKLNSGWPEFETIWEKFLIDIIKPFFSR